MNNLNGKISFFYNTTNLVRLLIVVQILFLTFQFFPWPSTNGDNAKYIALAQSLFSGNGYRQIYSVANSAETQYPILFPLLISVFNLFSNPILFSKLLVSFFSIGMTILSYYLFRKILGQLIIPYLLLIVTSSLIAQYSVIVMSEIPYLFLTLASLLMLKISEEKNKNKLIFGSTIIISILPVFFRSIGITFSVAWVLYALWNKNYKYAFYHIGVLAIILFSIRFFIPHDAPYLVQLLQRNSYDPQMGYVSVSEMFARIITNIGRYTGSIIRFSMVPFLSDAFRFLEKPLDTILVLSIIVGWVRGLFSKQLLLSLYILLYFAVLSMWQTQWSGDRFIVAILPYLYLFFILGIDSVLRFINKSSERPYWYFFKELQQNSSVLKLSRIKMRIIWITVFIIVIFNIGYQFSRHKKEQYLTPDWKNFYSCADWVRIHTSPNSVIMSRKPELFYLRSRRKGVIYPFSHNVDDVIDAMKKNNVSYVVNDDFSWTTTTAKYLYPAISQYPQKFRIVYALKNPDTFVLEFIGQ